MELLDMNIEQALFLLRAQETFSRTPIGRPITEEALEAVKTTIADTKNYNSETATCRNCGIILSSLIVPEGCINCGSKDMDIGKQ